MRDVPTGQRSLDRATWLGAALTVVTVGVFTPGLFGRFLWDDHALIQRNPALRSWRSLAHALARPFWDVPAVGGFRSQPNGYYRPVVTLAYGLQWRIFGDHPLGFHAVSLALHVACVLLVYAWLKRRLAAHASADLAAAVGAGLFALHPTRPESVTWVSGSTDLWMSLGVLSGLWAWDRRRDSLAVVALVLAMFAKESAALIPAALAFDVVLLSTDREVRRRELGRVGALAVVLSLAFGGRLAWVSGRANSVALDGPWESTRRVLATVGCYVRAAVFHWPPKVHLGVKLLDAQHRAVYPGWTLPLGAVTIVALAAMGLASVRRKTLRPWLADVGWFVLPLAPALNVVNLRLAVLAEPHNLYLPVVGLAAMTARGAQNTLTHGHRALAAVAIPLLTVCAAVSVFHETRLRSDGTLWTWEHRVDPEDLLAIQSLAAVAREGGRPGEALWLDAQGAATARRLGLRSTVAVFDRSATEDALVTVTAGSSRFARVRTFCDEITHGTQAELSLAGATVDVPVGAVWRRTLATDPAFVTACHTAVREAAQTP